VRVGPDILVLLDITKVELVGQNLLASVVAPVCVLVGTLVGALLAARFANRRMSKQLDNANDRLAIELANDRRLRREEHQRDALDTALKLANELHYSVQQAINRLESVRTENERLDSTERPDIVRGLIEAQSKKLGEELKVFERVPELRAAAGPLKVRFGAAHDVPSAVEALADAWRNNSNDLRLAPFDRGNFPKMEQWRDRIRVSRQAFESLLSTSQQWLEQTDSVPIGDAEASRLQVHAR
jgi:hypothetical protein